MDALDALPDARRVDVDAVAVSARNDLGIARDDEDASLLCRRADVRDDTAQRLDGKALLEDEGER